MSIKRRVNIFRCPENQPFDTKAKSSNYYQGGVESKYANNKRWGPPAHAPLMVLYYMAYKGLSYALRQTIVLALQGIFCLVRDPWRWITFQIECMIKLKGPKNRNISSSVEPSVILACSKWQNFWKPLLLQVFPLILLSYLGNRGRQIF